MDDKELITTRWITTKPGRNSVKITFNRANLYFSLRDLGLRHVHINRKSYFYYCSSGIVVTSLLRVQDMMWEKLQATDFPNKAQTLEAYLTKNPVKNNEALRRILRDEPSDDAKHQIRMQADWEYQRKMQSLSGV